MDNQVIGLLRSPGELDTLNLFEERNGRKFESRLIATRSRKEFPVFDGVPVLVNSNDSKVNRGRFRGREYKIPEEFHKELEITEKDKVLEVLAGTGLNLVDLPQSGKTYGIDNSMEMLKRCKKRLKSQGVKANLVMGDLDSLPFASDVFDFVFSVGAIGLFGEKSKIIREMVRVAKPGGKVMIIDYNRHGVALESVPQDMKQVRVKELPAGNLYCLTFQKPEVKRLGIFNSW